MAAEIKGIIAAMVTAMNEDETLNEQEIRHQINRQIAAGVNAIFCLGTNGEFYIQSEEEKLRVMKIFVDEAKGRVPVYAGTGCPGTKATIDLSLKAKEIGVDVLSIISPYFAAISQKEIYEHYKAIAEAVDLPIVMYNMPARTGNNIDPATCAELAKIPNIKGIKDSSGNWDNLKGYIDATRGMDFSVLSGNDSLILPCLLAGGQGGISGISNVFPERMVEIYEAWKAGDMERAWKVQRSIRPVRDCMAMANPNSVVKRAAYFMGQDLGPCRAPFNLQDDSLDDKIKAAIEEVKKRG